MCFRDELRTESWERACLFSDLEALQEAGDPQMRNGSYAALLISPAKNHFAMKSAGLVVHDGCRLFFSIRWTLLDAVDPRFRAAKRPKNGCFWFTSTAGAATKATVVWKFSGYETAEKTLLSFLFRERHGGGNQQQSSSCEESFPSLFRQVSNPSGTVLLHAKSMISS